MRQILLTPDGTEHEILGHDYIAIGEYLGDEEGNVRNERAWVNVILTKTSPLADLLVMGTEFEYIRLHSKVDSPDGQNDLEVKVRLTGVICVPTDVGDNSVTVSLTFQQLIDEMK